jgi:hypothetical protein
MYGTLLSVLSLLGRIVSADTALWLLPAAWGTGYRGRKRWASASQFDVPRAILGGVSYTWAAFSTGA